MNRNTKQKLVKITDSIKYNTEQMERTMKEINKCLSKLGDIKRNLQKKRAEINKLLVLE